MSVKSTSTKLAIVSVNKRSVSESRAPSKFTMITRLSKQKFEPASSSTPALSKTRQAKRIYPESGPKIVDEKETKKSATKKQRSAATSSSASSTEVQLLAIPPETLRGKSTRRASLKARDSFPIHGPSLRSVLLSSITPTIIQTSAVVHKLESKYKLPFSRIPKDLSFVSPPSNLDLYNHENLHESIDLERYKFAIKNHGYDRSLVIIANVTDEIGRGVFAARDIKKGEFIGLYTGKIQLTMSSEIKEIDSSRYVYDLVKRINAEGFELTKPEITRKLQSAVQKRFPGFSKIPKKGYELIVDAEMCGNFTSLINDGGKLANVKLQYCVVNGRLELAMYSKTKITKGHQLLSDYGAKYWENIENSSSSQREELAPPTYILANFEEAHIGGS